MKDLLHYLVSQIVTHPDQIQITEQSDENQLSLELRVAPEDMGQIIGKNGKIISSLRTLIRLRNQVTNEVPAVTLHLEDTQPPVAA